MKKKGQNLVEYLLIAAIVAIACVTILMKVNMKSLRNYVFMQPADSTDSTQIKIKAMTE